MRFFLFYTYIFLVSSVFACTSKKQATQQNKAAPKVKTLPTQSKLSYVALKSFFLHKDIDTISFRETQPLGDFSFLYQNNNSSHWIDSTQIAAIGFQKLLPYNPDRYYLYDLHTKYAGDVAGFMYKAEVGICLRYFLFDKKGKLIKHLFSLNFGRDMSFIGNDFCIFKPNVIEIHELHASQTGFHHKTYTISIDHHLATHTQVLAHESISHQPHAAGTSMLALHQKFTATLRKYGLKVFE